MCIFNKRNELAAMFLYICHRYHSVAAAVMKIWIERTSQRRILWLLQQSQHQYETNFKDYKSRNKQDFDHYKALITFMHDNQELPTRKISSETQIQSWII